MQPLTLNLTSATKPAKIIMVSFRK